MEWGLISDITIVHEISDIGIMFLLFLLGLNLEIKSMINMLGKALFVSIASSLIFIVGCGCSGSWIWFGGARRY